MAREDYYVANHRDILAHLALDLRLPLLHIKNSLEQSTDLDVAISDELNLSVESGLRILEAYLLSTSLYDQSQLSLEPIALGAMLDDTAHILSPYAKRYEVGLEVITARHLKPVLMHRASGSAALLCLGESMIRAQAAQNPESNQAIILGAHGAAGKVMAGIYGAIENLNVQMLKSARSLAGKAHQPASGLAGHSTGGVLIADLLCSAMSEPLRVSQHKNLHGLATVFQPSSQLALL